MTNEEWKIVLDTYERFTSLSDGFSLVGEETKAEIARRSSEILEECISNLIEEEKNEPVQVGDYVEWNPDNEGPYTIAKRFDFWNMGQGPFKVRCVFKFDDMDGKDARGICYSFSNFPENLALKSSSFFRKVKRNVV